MFDKSFRQRLLDNDVTLGTFQILNSPMATEIAGEAGFDFVVVDQEHGPISAERAMEFCCAAECGGASPIIRVRKNDPAEIQRALDIGSSGVEIPQIETVADAEAAVSAARFPPLGERGLSPFGRAGRYAGGSSFTQQQNEEVTVIIQIEGTDGIENLDGILGVEGIDVVFIGPYDLSQSLGIPGQIQNEQLEEMMKEITDRALDEGKIVGTYAEDADMARKWINAGVQFIAIYEDAPILYDAFSRVINRVNK